MEGMTPRQTEAATTITNLLLSLPWTERGEVFSAVEHNHVFCVRCGYGESGFENPRCQCTNDE